MSESTRPRYVDTLRLSVTDKCNMRCRYCMPAEGVPQLRHDQVLRLEQMVRFVRLSLERGIRRVRITGGEPLVRRNIIWLVRELAALPDLEDLAMTTNGALLAQYAAQLKDAGLRRVNVSLDSLDPEKFRYLTRCGELDAVLTGIQSALDVGLDPVKINVVLMRGFNDDPAPFVELAARLPVHVRFIERMNFSGIEAPPDFVSVDEIAAKLEEIAPTDADGGPMGAGPARYVRMPGLVGSVGFIEEREGHACATCNRLRLSCDGTLRACLFQPKQSGVQVLQQLRDGDDAAVLAALDQAIAAKPRSRMKSFNHEAMSQIGG
ncbi:MAG: GTP 3',8-cyclase MoaA [Candidatus Alcyoniella australis]|nr:GTP 3',8-cyclase MoaA [Candidatus Alcyoniella australis]